MEATTISTILSQLAFINAILGGFALAFVGALLSSDQNGKIENWTAGSAIAASCSFTVSAVLSTAGSMYVLQQGVDVLDKLPTAVNAIWNPTIAIFFIGLFFFALSIGFSGWLFSKTVGICSTIAALTLFITSAALLLIF